MKRFISLLLALMMCLSVTVAVFADEYVTEDEAGLVATSDDSGKPTRAEETCWYFRTVNGIRQMRDQFIGG